MSRVGETQRAYDELAKLLDQEILKRRGSAKELARFRETLDVAFYLRGWAQFEYLVTKEAEELVNEKARLRTVERYAWEHLKTNIKGVSIRRRLDLIFHDDQGVRNKLDRDYSVRNESAHDYKLLPNNARNVSLWLQELEDLVERFSR